MRIALFSVVLGMSSMVQAQFGEMLSPRYYLAGTPEGGKLVARDGECPLPNSHSCKGFFIFLMFFSWKSSGRNVSGRNRAQTIGFFSKAGDSRPDFESVPCILFFTFLD